MMSFHFTAALLSVTLILCWSAPARAEDFPLEEYQGGSRWYLWFMGIAVVSLILGWFLWRNLQQRRLAAADVPPKRGNGS